MIKLTDLILEVSTRPKVVIMAGAAGAGKTYLLNQLSLDSLRQVNPDKYIEDPDHQAYNNLGAGARLADKEAEDLADDKISFVWDTTASNPEKIQSFLDKGYDVYIVMVYTHPMIAYASNFSRGRNIPGSAVFSTWRKVYQLIDKYNKMTKGNMSIFINDRGGKFDQEIEGFNTAAKNGPAGIKDYLQKYNEKNDIEGSTFFKPVEMSAQEEEEFNKATANIDYNRDKRSEDKAVKQAFLKSYRANGVGPGDDQLKAAIKKYRDKKQKLDKNSDEVLDNIADLIFSPLFQKKLEHSTPQEIDKKVQAFLA